MFKPLWNCRSELIVFQKIDVNAVFFSEPLKREEVALAIQQVLDKNNLFCQPSFPKNGRVFHKINSRWWGSS